jgi:aryl-alcohol dehydrogenase-like predicted oxidoreductase
VSPIGLGCWQFSKGQGVAGRFWDPIEQPRIDEIVQASVEAGVTWFDTAELYGDGASEKALASALGAAGRTPGGVVIATKWTPFLRRAGHISRSIEQRVRCLAPFPIDLHQVHQHMPFSSVERQMDAMADLVAKGTIRAVGVSNFGEGHMRRAHERLAGRGLPLASNQVRYSLLDRRIERNGVLDAASELGVSIIAYSPLAQGLLTGRFHADPERAQRPGGARRRMRAFRPQGLARSAPVVEALIEIGERHGRSPAQVALNWVVHARAETVLAIPGATRVDQAHENADAAGFRLTEDERSRLDEVSRPFLEG